MLEICLILVVAYIIITWIRRKFHISSSTGRSVFITGCDTGFGHALAVRLDGLGMHVFAGCLTDQGATKLTEICSSRLKTIILNVTKEEDIQNAVDVVNRSLPDGQGLWGLVNNAGIAGPWGFIELIPQTDFQQVLDVNLMGLINVTKAFLPLLRKCGGRVVNITSAAGRLGVPCAAPYTVSKFGVEAFSDTLRREVGIFGVTVHIIEPGFMPTELLQHVADGTSDHIALELFDQANPELKEVYGRDYFAGIAESARLIICKILRVNKVNSVIDAMTHALIGKYPKYRYVLGWDATLLIDVISRLPEWIQDVVITYGNNQVWTRVQAKHKQL